MKSFLLLSIILIALGVTLLVNIAQAASQDGNTSLASDARTSVATDARSPGETCATACQSASVIPTCCQWAPCTSFYADFLWLRPRNEGIEYAVPINGPIGTNQAPVVPVQDGPTAIVDPNFSAGFRVGFDRAISDCGSIYGEYTYFRNTTSDSTSTSAPLVLRAMVLNPSTLDAAADWLNANASSSTDFDLVDIGYHYNVWACNQNNLGLFAGVRYGHLNQQFQADYSNIVTDTVDAGVNFDGVGPRIGTDGNWCIGKGFFLHGKVSASFLGGEYSANYSDTSPTATSNPVAATSWHEACLTSIIDGELGIGWETCSGRIRVMAGYSISDWCNVVKPSDFIAGVQANSYRAANQLGQTSLIFDGMMARAEINW